MTTEQFNEIVQLRVGKIYAVLAKKATEYARGDRLHNFKKAGVRLAQDPVMALRGMMEKHLTSVDDMMLDVNAGKIPSKEYVDEKVGDAINYMILLEALIEDRRNELSESEVTVDEVSAPI
jgi:hypothetical protein